MQDKRTSDIMTKWLKTALAILIIAGSYWVLGQIGAVVKMVVIAALLAYMLDPIVGYLESHGIGRTLSTVIVFVVIVSFITIAITLIAPQASQELSAIKNGISAGKASDILQNLEVTLEEKLAFLGVGDLDLTGKIQTLSKNTANKVYKYFLN